MSSLPPLAPIAPVEAATPQTTTTSQPKDNSKSFAKLLDVAKTNDAPEARDTPADKPVAETCDKPVDKAAPVEGEATDATTAATQAAVVGANLATNAAIEVVTTTAVEVTTQAPVTNQAVATPALPVVATTPAEAETTPVISTLIPEGEVATQGPATPTTDAPDIAATAPVADTDAPVVAIKSETAAGVVDASTEGLLSALSKDVEVAVTAGEATTETKPLSTEHAARNIIDALSPKSSTQPVVSAPAVSGANPADIPTPVRQLVNLVAPLRHHGDGDYKLLLQLHPEHLGRVEVAVSLNAGQISMQLSSDNAASRQMLREQMNELRNSLSDAGLDTGSLDVSSQGFQQQHTNDTQSGQNSQIGNQVADSDEDEFFSRLATVVNPPATDGQLDAYV